jgi:hypothetical protein
VKVGGAASATATTSDDRRTAPRRITDTDSGDDSSASSSAGSGDSALSYKPGTYSVNQQIASDLLGDTVTLDSITVDGNGDVTAEVTTPTKSPASGRARTRARTRRRCRSARRATDASGSTDCTKDPSKTWYMTTGQHINSGIYFSQPPTGSGAWTFSLNTDEFQGSVSGISIPTQ